MKKTFIFICIVAAMLCSCTSQPRRITIDSEQMIAVDSSMDNIRDTDYEAALADIQARLNKELNVKIGYAPQSLTVHQPECEMLNWACDALYDMAVQVYDGQVDFAVVNIGGMRCDWQAGDITRRHIYELMPFDNMLVILTLTGQDIIDLCNIFAEQGGQGVSRQLRMEMKNKKARNITLNGKNILPEAYYYVATSDYLSGGADHFTPLARFVERMDTNCKIRDLYLKYAEQQQTIAAAVDGRMKQL